MTIATSTGLWLGNRGGRYLVRRTASIVWWANMHKDGLWAGVFRGAAFKNGIGGEWVQVWRSDANRPTADHGQAGYSQHSRTYQVSYTTGDKHAERMRRRVEGDPRPRLLVSPALDTTNMEATNQGFPDCTSACGPAKIGASVISGSLMAL